MRGRAITFALVAAIPTGLLAVTSIIRTMRDFADPCLQWGVPQQGAVSLALPREGKGPCAQRVAGTSETKVAAVTRLVLVPGGMLIGVALGILGAFRSRPLLSGFAAGILLLESAALIFSVAPLTLLASGIFLLSARAAASAQKLNEGRSHGGATV